MKRTILLISIVVLAISLAAVAADNRTVVTAQPKGGTANRGPEPLAAPVYSNLAVKDPNGLYYCCSGNVIAGSANAFGEPNFAEAIQFTTTAATTVHRVRTSVNYIVAGTSTDVLIAIEADASGVPSGTPLAHAKVTLNSQTFGGCCELETHGIGGKNGVSLPAGTYWVVWYTDSGSDLYAEVNQEILDQVTPKTVAYSESNGATGTWNAYSYVLGFSVGLQ